MHSAQFQCDLVSKRNISLVSTIYILKKHENEWPNIEPGSRLLNFMAEDIIARQRMSLGKLNITSKAALIYLSDGEDLRTSESRNESYENGDGGYGSLHP